MQEPNLSDDQLEFAEQYVEAMMTKLWTYKNWAIGDLMFRDCPREHIECVAFVFLGHLVTNPHASGSYH